ncbi:hypothetical protein [Infirmifilum sp. NZ]|uniref:hypothetical protein n=1 Tax=Infirmifilum sp. NZ TaxID=2926850 RepID=UPI0027AA5C43|nr:hypothetical protein [Infirmifilum sp. NZ]UNQ73401.1 hypothetical protein MOV14_09855 [Infirmifilum sp. NZ]
MSQEGARSAVRPGRLLLGSIVAIAIHVLFDYLGPAGELLAGFVPGFAFASSYLESIVMSVVGSLVGDGISGLIVLSLLKASASMLRLPEFIPELGSAFILFWVAKGMVLSSIGALAGFKLATALRRSVKGPSSDL